MGQKFGVNTCADAGGEDADGTAFANALGQASFRAVAVAANDAASVFQKEAGELTSLFLVWALQETQRYADMLVGRLLFPLQHTVACTVMLGMCPCCLQWELMYKICLASLVLYPTSVPKTPRGDLFKSCADSRQARIRNPPTHLIYQISSTRPVSCRVTAQDSFGIESPKLNLGFAFAIRDWEVGWMLLVHIQHSL